MFYREHVTIFRKILDKFRSNVGNSPRRIGLFLDTHLPNTKLEKNVSSTSQLSCLFDDVSNLDENCLREHEKISTRDCRLPSPKKKRPFSLYVYRS